MKNESERLAHVEKVVLDLVEIVQMQGRIIDTLSGSIAILGGLTRDPEEGQGVQP
jgi:hypothetical protein